MASNADLEDVNCVVECDPLFSKTGGMLSVMQSLVRACTTPRGSHPINKSRFFNIKAYVNREITGKDLLIIAKLIETEASYDTRIESCRSRVKLARGENNQPVLAISTELVVDKEKGSFMTFLNVSTGEIRYSM